MAGGDDDDNSEDLRIQEVSASEIDTSISQLRGTPSPLSGKKGNFTSSAIGGNNNDFKRYYYDPDERIYDMFTMIDFYGRKKYCLEMGHPLTKEDDKWYRDQRYRILKRIKALKEAGPNLVENYDSELKELNGQLKDLAFLDSKEAKSGGRKGSQRIFKKTKRGDDEYSLATDHSLKEIDELLMGSTMAIANRVSQGTGNNAMKDVIFNEKVGIIKQNTMETRQQKKAVESALMDKDVI